MMPALHSSKRYRGFILTANGWRKLQQGIQQIEKQTRVKQNARTLAEKVQLFTPEGIHPMTVRKILQCQQGVDRRSLEQLFIALDLALTEGDYAHTALQQELHEIQSLRVVPDPSSVYPINQPTNDICPKVDTILKTMILNNSTQVLTLIEMANGYCMIVTNY